MTFYKLIMFSFGGFSSVIPYIAYLSVMWVCILIGFGGQIMRSYGINSHSLNEKQLIIKEKKTINQKAISVISFGKILLKSKKIFENSLIFQYQPIKGNKNEIYEGFKFHVKSENEIICGLRAPPFYA